MSDTYTVVLSGPLAQRSPVLRALQVAGITADPADETAHGHDISDPTVGWVTCRADHPDRAVEVVTPLGWGLRSHFPTPPVPEAADDMGTRLARLEAAMAEKGILS